ncbi:hypothetical protein DES49_1601 [Halospina denitrificans]|uniref:Uncharacterized protein n=1 Tax=Halospina denitrificans TaxID=332522 RepID=A0A4R7JUI4_9GAMM|nr:hypothetical protein [Halospina denitrificans]TDT41506.1 hypothetical protein DES49_1601 [Halospina denitrificans]
MRFTYPAEKLNEARACLMLPHLEGEEGSIANAFHACHLGLKGIETEEVSPFLDESAKDWIKVIQGMMNTEKVEDEKGEGAWIVKARSLSVEERLQLSRCVDELASWFDMHEDDDV